MKRCFVTINGVQGWGEGSTYAIAARKAAAEALRRLTIRNGSTFEAKYRFESAVSQYAVTHSRIDS